LKMKEESNIFFVGVREPEEVKKNLLESLKEVVESLRRFEKFKEIREEKARNISKLRDDIKELAGVASRLKAALPETKLRIAVESFKKPKKKRHAGKKAEAQKTEVKKEAIDKVRRPVSELEKLEAELSAIESKLSALK